MSDQPLDLKRSVRIVGRHKVIVGAVAALGAVAGAAFAFLSPPMVSSNAIVVLPTATKDAATQVVIASSQPVLEGALRTLGPGYSLRTLRADVKVLSVTTNILSITVAQATAKQAEAVTNAVADSYVAYVSSPASPGGKVVARTLGPATATPGKPRFVVPLIFAAIGALVGALLGAIGVLAFNRRDRHLRMRDEIANSVGIPVLASIAARHPSDAAGWAKLLAEYEPGALHAWGMRSALRQLGLWGIDPSDPSAGRRASVAVLSLASDPGALALGPQLAVFAASLGIRTTLVIGPQQNPNATASLRAACNLRSAAPSRWSGYLQVVVIDRDEDGDPPNAALTVVVAVVDGAEPQIAQTMRTTTTVLGVSAGAATADELARVAVNAAGDNRAITGIFVADPDSADSTTGRIPQSAVRAAPRRIAAPVTGMTTETSR
jgi:capsular polysaccharide biosynthesis protein